MLGSGDFVAGNGNFFTLAKRTTVKITPLGKKHWARPIDAKTPKSETNQRRELVECGR